MVTLRQNQNQNQQWTGLRTKRTKTGTTGSDPSSLRYPEHPHRTKTCLLLHPRSCKLIHRSGPCCAARHSAHACPYSDGPEYQTVPWSRPGDRRTSECYFGSGEGYFGSGEECVREHVLPRPHQSVRAITATIHALLHPNVPKERTKTPSWSKCLPATIAIGLRPI